MAERFNWQPLFVGILAFQTGCNISPTYIAPNLPNCKNTDLILGAYPDTKQPEKLVIAGRVESKNLPYQYVMGVNLWTSIDPKPKLLLDALKDDRDGVYRTSYTVEPGVKTLYIFGQTTVVEYGRKDYCIKESSMIYQIGQ